MADIEWQTMWRLFHAAVETPSDERSAFLDDECGRATPLRHRLDRLLSVSDRAPDFLTEDLQSEVPITISGHDNQVVVLVFFWTS